jgi:hypothetical protein
MAHSVKDSDSGPVSAIDTTDRFYSECRESLQFLDKMKKGNWEENKSI